MSKVSNTVERRPAVRARACPQSLYSCAGKRLLDASLAIISLALAAPVFVLCAIAIKLQSRGPVLFRQIRIGRLGRPFWIFKFRSMIHGHSGLHLTAAG